MTLTEFYREMTRRMTKNERKGQAAFNLLAEVRPDLSEQVCGTEMDPFYDAVGSWQKFYQFLEENW